MQRCPDGDPEATRRIEATFDVFELLMIDPACERLDARPFDRHPKVPKTMSCEDGEIFLEVIAETVSVHRLLEISPLLPTEPVRTKPGSFDRHGRCAPAPPEVVGDGHGGSVTFSRLLHMLERHTGMHDETPHDAPSTQVSDDRLVPELNISAEYQVIILGLMVAAAMLFRDQILDFVGFLF